MSKPKRSLESGRKLEYHPEEDYYYGSIPFKVTVTGKNKKKRPYWVSPKGAGNTALTIGDLSKAYTAATAGLLPNPISAGINLSQGKVLNALEDMWLYNSAHNEDPNVNYGVVGFSAPEGSLFSSISKAAKATPKQWTAAQDAAIARGDMAEAQRLRDLHFRVSAPNTKVIDEKGNPLTMYHGTTPEGDYILRHKGVQYKPNGLNMFFTSNYYGQYLGGPNTKSVPLYINATKIRIPGNHYEIGSANPLRHLKKGQDALYEWGFLKNNDFATNEAFEAAQNAALSKEISWAKSKGFNLDLDNIDELDMPKFLKAVEKDINIRGIGHHPVEEFAIPKGEQIKLTDAVTYDDKGIRIPLGKRDNFKLNDIRYALIPAIATGVGYGVNKMHLDEQRSQKRNGGSIHIAPSKRGTFTAAATKHGMGVQAFASKVLANKDNYSPAMVKKANFARNASKWNH